MIREWHISNFKALPAKGGNPLELNSLNILVGPNSSGKSTLIQSILMVAQTLNNSSGERPFILNGELVRLGHARDVLNDGNTGAPMRLRFVLETRVIDDGSALSKGTGVEEISVNTELALALPKMGNMGFDILRTELDRKSGAGIIVQKSADGNLASSLDEYQQWAIDPVLRNQINKGLFNYIVLRQPRSLITTERPLSITEKFPPQVSLFHFLPEMSLEFYDRRAEFISTTVRYLADAVYREDATLLQENLKAINLKNDRDAEPLKEAIRTAIENQIRTYDKSVNRSAYNLRRDESASFQALNSLSLDLKVVHNLVDWIKLTYQKLSRNSRQGLSEHLTRVSASAHIQSILKDRSQQLKNSIGVRVKPLPPEISLANREIIDFFTKRLRYLGPLRDDPRAIYGIPFNPETKDVGVKGEFTAAVIERYKEEVVQCPLPPKGEKYESTSRSRKLLDGISAWLNYLGLVENVTTRDLGKIGYELMVRSTGVNKELDLMNVGVGVSQVLPTLVMALLAPEDSLLLFEQPELHLHPKVQSRLGDFLLGIALSGKQCIVETHSEYLVNRIRRRIAEAKGSTLLDQTSIYFVEREEKGAKFTRVIPNEYGAILSWPQGFFDEGPAEAELIMQAAMAKRKENITQKKTGGERK